MFTSQPRRRNRLVELQIDPTRHQCRASQSTVASTTTGFSSQIARSWCTSLLLRPRSGDIAPFHFHSAWIPITGIVSREFDGVIWRRTLPRIFVARGIWARYLVDPGRWRAGSTGPETDTEPSDPANQLLETSTERSVGDGEDYNCPNEACSKQGKNPYRG